MSVEAHLADWAFAGLWLIIFAATSLWRVMGVLMSRFMELSEKDLQHLSELAAASLMAQMASLVWRPVGSLVHLPLEARIGVVCLAIMAWLASGRSTPFGIVMGVGGIMIAAG